MDEKLLNNLKDLKQALKEKGNNKLKMIIGLDGFVDEIIHVVDTRQDFENYTRLDTIDEFGKRISRAAGLSTNIEFISNQTKLGGNGPILSNALIEYGVDLTYIGCLGKNSIHPVFVPMSEKSKVYSICDPGHTDAVEFTDGKLMLGKIELLKEITWESIKEKVGGLDNFVEMVKESDLFGMENWTMIPHMSEIWESIITEVFPKLPEKAEKPIAFFDLADPEKRTKADILAAMKLIGKFSQKFRVILGLNEKEVYEIAEVYDIKIDNNLQADEKLKFAVTKCYEHLGIYCLVVHPTKEAVACMNGEYFHTFGPYCKKPVLTTGAGDNFNAGFTFGQTIGLGIQDSLLLGVCTSGYYVRNAKSPTLANVIEFIADWESGKILD